MTGNRGVSLPAPPAGLSALLERRDDLYNASRQSQDAAFDLADEIAKSLPSDWARQFETLAYEAAKEIYKALDSENSAQVAQQWVDLVSMIGGTLSSLDNYADHRLLYGSRYRYIPGSYPSQQAEDAVYALGRAAGYADSAAFGRGVDDFALTFDAIEWIRERQ